VTLVRAHPVLTSAGAGFLLAVAAFAFGGGTADPIGVGLAILIGSAFAVAMWVGMRRGRRQGS
jgi:hypothetical protein